jgi:hypothetical protein
VKLSKVWLVRDPSRTSTLVDICWEQEVARLDRYVLGSPGNAWTNENHAMFATEKEAKEEAGKRLALLAERYAQIARGK